MELFKDIAAVVGCILSVISLITICTKAGRDAIKSIFARNTKDLHECNSKQEQDIQEIKTTLDKLYIDVNLIKDYSIQDCRNTIKNIYYKYCMTKHIPLYDRKTVDRVYDLYHNKFKTDNTYATLLYDEICKWDIDMPDSYMEED